MGVRLSARGPWRTWFVAFVATVPLAVVSCRGLLGISDGDGTADAGDASTSPTNGDGATQAGDAGAPEGDGAVGSADAGASTADGAGAATNDAATGYFEWPEWPLPGVSPGAANYTATADTVTDKTTGLMWERGYSERLVNMDAPGHCITLRAGGFSDWRLPTWIELLSIVDYGKKSPAIDVSTFPPDAGATDWFWSSTVSARTGLTLSVLFNDGSMAGLSTAGTQLWRVRCVRVP